MGRCRIIAGWRSCRARRTCRSSSAWRVSARPPCSPRSRASTRGSGSGLGAQRTSPAIARARLGGVPQRRAPVPVYLARSDRRPALLDAAIASLESQTAEAVQLVYRPPIDMAKVGEEAAGGDTETQWADVRFRIAPDGRVADVAVLRRSTRLPNRWLAPALESLRGRRYAPLKLPPGSPGPTRLERYSIVSDLVAIEATRMPVRASVRRVDILDLSEPPPAARCLIPGFNGALFTSEWKGCVMGQTLNESATTTEAVRRAIQHRQENLRHVNFEVTPFVTGNTLPTHATPTPIDRPRKRTSKLYWARYA